MSDTNNKNKRTGQLQSSAEVLHGLLANGKTMLADQFTCWRVAYYWRQIAGEMAADHSRPSHFDRGILWVWVDSAARMQEMTFILEPLAVKVNQFVGREWCRSLRLTRDKKMLAKDSIVG